MAQETQQQNESEARGREASGLHGLLCGVVVKADHPVTCLNPDETFPIYECRIDNDKLYCRGEKTMWFHAALLERVAT
jgi:hypothetical protein